MGTGKKSIYAEPPIMVLKDNSDRRLLFTFRSFLYGCVTAVFAILISVMAYYVVFIDAATPLIVRIFVVILAVAFAYGSITSFTTHRALEINFTTKSVIVLESSLFGTKQRKEPFSSYKCLSVKQNYDATNYCIMLESNDGWIEYLGWNEFGALSLTSALELVNKIAPKMGIEINAPTCFEEKPLAR